MKHGARNDIPARITAIKRGGVMHVDVRLEGTAYRMTSVMTNDSLDGLGVKEGDLAHVVAKAVNVVLVTD